MRNLEILRQVGYGKKGMLKMDLNRVYANISIHCSRKLEKRRNDEWVFIGYFPEVSEFSLKSFPLWEVVPKKFKQT